MLIVYGDLNRAQATTLELLSQLASDAIAATRPASCDTKPRKPCSIYSPVEMADFGDKMSAADSYKRSLPSLSQKIRYLASYEAFLNSGNTGKCGVFTATGACTSGQSSNNTTPQAP